MTQDERAQSLAWAKETTQRVGRAVRARRTRLKLSAQNVSEACSKVGYQIPRNTIANLENGRKAEVTLAEVMTLAAALRVPPVQLIFPDLPEGQCEFLPGETTTALHALKWFTGEAAFRDRLPTSDSPDYHMALVRELDHSAARHMDLRAQLEKVRADVAAGRVDAEIHKVVIEDQIHGLRKQEQLIRQTLADAGFCVAAEDPS